MPGHSCWGLHFWPKAQCRSDWNLGGNRRFEWGKLEFHFYVGGYVSILNKIQKDWGCVTSRSQQVSDCLCSLLVSSSDPPLKS
jgi:hypothetical protein